MKLYTIGYQRFTQATLVRALRVAGVGSVLDVREHAHSTREEFCRPSLMDGLLGADIWYEHVPEAGNPFRKEELPIAEILGKYRAHVADRGAHNPAVVAVGKRIMPALGRGRTTALLCGCADPLACHRSVLAAHVVPLCRPFGTWSVEHIPSPEPKAPPSTQLSLLGGGK